MIYDLILCAAFAGMFIYGWHRGLLRTVWGLASLALTFILTMLLKQYALEISTLPPPATVAILFICIRICLALVYRVLDAIMHFPILKQTNSLAGALAELLITLALVYAILGASALLGSDLVSNTILCKYFYDNNLLLMLLNAHT